jgi:hypothetical protein
MKNEGSCLDALMFIVMFITICLVRCDQVKEKEFNYKTKEIENMIEWTQKQNAQLKQQNDSLYIMLKEIKDKK